MFVSHAFSQSRYLLATALGVLFSHTALAGTAGRVNFVVGEATAISPDNKQRLLYKGDLVNSGERIETSSKGRIQIRMTDGGFLALRPNSVFQIEKFDFSRDTPDQSALVFKFIKGGMRTISGAIGKVNRASYQLSTPMATIGIRGTDYASTLNNDVLAVTVNQGQINLANEFGSVDIPEGQTYETRLGQAPVPSSAVIEQETIESEEEVKPKPDARPTPISTAAKSAVVASAAGTVADAPMDVPRPRLENYASYNQFLQAMYSFKKFEEEKNSPKLSVKGAPAGSTLPEFSEFPPPGGTGDVVDGGESLEAAKVAGALILLNDDSKESDRFAQQALARSSFTNFPLKAADGQDLRLSSVEDTLNSGFNSEIALIDNEQVMKYSLSSNNYSAINQQFQNLDKLYQRFFLRVAGSKFFGNTMQLYMENEQFNEVEITVIQRNY